MKAPWFAWMEEYPDEGCIAVDAETEEEARAEAAKHLLPEGSVDPGDDPPPLSVRRVTAEDIERMLDGDSSESLILYPTKRKPADMRYAIKVIWRDGEEEYLKEGSRPATFANRERADSMRAFMLEGMDPEDIQSINVVPTPPAGEGGSGT